MTTPSASSEHPFAPISAWPVLITELVLLAGLLAVFRQAGALMLLVILVTLPGFFIVGPNMARVLVLFGKYKGTVRKQGFFWTNPFTLKHKLSLKVHNIASETIKVNDSRGNPIEIGAVVVWQVRDTAQALFDVEDYASYVDIQAETSVRAIASSHPYDEGGEEDVVSLRGDSTQVAHELQAMLAEQLERAGIEVLESRISHLAYAPEIAQAMLQRQQAEAIIAARAKIVEGAVSMVQHALDDLSERGVVELDGERRASMVSNLLVVLCGQENARPIITAG
ncbi:MAG: SPFH domain-containing protein [Planctomycetota bacterium]|jgi:regulator of protease activity HflC (stomatin/prohibitin superfamily)|nr:SPFH domain-containing protein [Planctomycetota bacterium]MDP6764088.1 SPFH domain-containing protein [Planctomycetota bacterium]MDP6989804.1 SPFH domain-containing protein [Planctomycetota bacterium]